MIYMISYPQLKVLMIFDYTIMIYLNIIMSYTIMLQDDIL